MKPSRVLLLLLCCMAQSCAMHNQATRVASAEPSQIEQARALIGPEWPMDMSVRLTTSGDTYLANLDGQIATLKVRMEQRPSDPVRAALALMLYHRFQIVGNLDDAEQARKGLQEAGAGDHDPAIDLANVQILLGFHAFDQAQTALDSARQNGANEKTTDTLQQSIDRATGSNVTREVAVLAGADNELEPVAQVTRAADLLERGQAAAASRLLKLAQDNYEDTSPYLLAWIYVQQGIAFLRYQDYASAAVFFAAAHERFPQYALATEHLAEAQLGLKNHEQAADLYRSVSAQTGNPEFYYRLSKAEFALGETDQAQRDAAQAETGYADLVQKYGLMYGDHAARYYMDVGKLQAALELALANIRARQDIRARMLLLEAHVLTGQNAVACDELAAIQTLGFAPPELPGLSAALAGACSADSKVGAI